MESKIWQKQLDEILPYYGHRNWILVTDMAFPKQSSNGIRYINTNENLTGVLQQVLDKLSKSEHIKPVIYTDKELAFITEKQAKGINKLRNTILQLTKEWSSETLLHEDVFGKLNESSNLFETLVLKTNCTIPYSSVFIYLDCKYWNEVNETTLRNAMG